MTPGDIFDVDFGLPTGSEAGFSRPAVLLNAREYLRISPSTVFVVPLTRTFRPFPSYVEIQPDAGNGLSVRSFAAAEQLRSVSVQRCNATGGNVGALKYRQLAEVVAYLIQT